MRIYQGRISTLKVTRSPTNWSPDKIEDNQQKKTKYMEAMNEYPLDGCQDLQNIFKFT